MARTLATLPDLASQAMVKPPALVIVGEVVRLRGKLAWFERGQTLVDNSKGVRPLPTTERQ